MPASSCMLYSETSFMKARPWGLGAELMNEESLFAAALEKQDTAERQAFLDEACDGDVALRQRLEQLLAGHEHAPGILECGPEAAALKTERSGLPLAVERIFAGRFKLRQKLGAGGM